MKKLLFGSVLLAIVVIVHLILKAGPLQILQPAQPLVVRVLLETKEAKNGVLWTLSSDEGFVVSDPYDTARHQTVEAHEVVIGLKRNNILTVNNRRLLVNRVRVESTNGLLRVNGHAYKGCFYIIKQDEKILLINAIELEEYVESGLRWELVPSWPDAALEAGAVAYRTYVSRLIQDGYRRFGKNKEGRWYDIGCTWMTQCYRGVHSHASIHEAVRKTRGQVLTYHGEPISALYGAACGGIIPAKRYDVNRSQTPYLARTYRCSHCKPCKYYQWSARFMLSELSQKLQGFFPRHPRMTDIKIAERDASGFVKKISFYVNHAWITVPTAKVIAAIPQLKSSTFSLSKTRHNVTFKGSGFGHQLGFCQWGAYGLSKQGWNYRKILKFYYPGTTIMKFEDVAKPEPKTQTQAEPMVAQAE